MFKNNFQEALLILVHAVARGNHKEIRNEGFHRYFNKVHKINSVDKVSLTNGRKAYYLHCILGMQTQ